MLVERAFPGAEAGVFRGWLALRIAEEHAFLGERDACLPYLELAQSEGDRGDGSGFFSTQAFYPSWESDVGWRRGRCLALLGEPEPALAELSAAASSGSVRMRALIAADNALAWVMAGDPEPACVAAMRSLHVSEALGYAVRIQRVREVRARFDEPWASLARVRALDEGLGV